jgi:DNA-binding XRE family transcriptional regulator
MHVIRDTSSQADGQIPLTGCRNDWHCTRLNALALAGLKSLKDGADTTVCLDAPDVDTSWMRFCGGTVVPGNNVQRYRESLMMSKAELARKAGLSSLTIDRIEAGRPCRLDTKRKILLALGLRVSDKDQVFGMLAIASEERSAEPAPATPLATDDVRPLQ